MEIKIDEAALLQNMQQELAKEQMEKLQWKTLAEQLLKEKQEDKANE